MNSYYDLIVIGAGPGGYPAAIAAAKLGKTVAVIDRNAPGGTCLNTGCIPMKTLLHTSQLYREVCAAEETGLSGETLACDMDILSRHREQIIRTLSEGILTQFKKYGITFISGSAQITGEQEVSISGADTQKLSGKNILIAAGSESSRLPVPGLDLPGIDTSTTLLARSTLYKSLVIIGGGVIGMEFASLYTDFGIPVTILEAADSILPNMDKETARNLKMILQKRGGEIHTAAKVCKVEQSSGQYICTYREGDQEKMVVSEGILVAAGRSAVGNGVCTPEFANLLGIKKGCIPVDGQFRTAVPGIYAVGDVTGTIQLAHAASAAGLNAVSYMYGIPPVKDMSLIPACVYTDPEIASVGMSENDAAAAGKETVTGKYIMSLNGKSVLSQQERGFIKIIAERGSGYIIGARLMCARATDMISMLQLAISRHVTVEELASLVLPHPTFSEGIAEAAAECKVS